MYYMNRIYILRRVTNGVGGGAKNGKDKKKLTDLSRYSSLVAFGDQYARARFSE